MFYSILFPDEARSLPGYVNVMPDYFHDLKLDLVADALSKGRDGDAVLKPFYTPLHDREAILYRQDVFRDLEREGLFKAVRTYADLLIAQAKTLAGIRECLAGADAPRNDYLTKSELLDLAVAYCALAGNLRMALKELAPMSAGLRGLLNYLDEYLASAAFMEMSAFAAKIKAELGEVRYSMLIKNDTVRVRRFDGELDLSRKIEDVFFKFAQEGVSYRKEIPEEPHARHMEAAVLSLVASLNRELFDSLDLFCARHGSFIDNALLRFARDAQFYIAYTDYIRWMRGSGLPFCYPEIALEPKQAACTDGFDIALAKSMALTALPVTNSFRMDNDERVLVVTGPNQSGKTTFARAFGQLFHLAMIGCCVPGSYASLCLCGRIFTHFEREEDHAGGYGKLKADLTRLHGILDSAFGDSVMVINEMLSSASPEDALPMAGSILNAIARLGAYAVCVTFLDALSEMRPFAVSMVSVDQSGDPSGRGYLVARGKASGAAYAARLADQYGLSFGRIKGRVRP
jgi:DNA mismatch repair protein MutS